MEKSYHHCFVCRYLLFVDLLDTPTGVNAVTKGLGNELGLSFYEQVTFKKKSLPRNGQHNATDASTSHEDLLLLFAATNSDVISVLDPILASVILPKLTANASSSF